MKYTLPYLAAIFSFASIKAQTNIPDLEIKKQSYQTQIKNLNDSINLIDKKIGILASKKALSQTNNIKINAVIRKGGRIKDVPNPVGKDLYVADSDRNVFIVDYIDDYFKICYEENCGYSNSIWIEPTPEITNFVANKKIIENDIITENANRIDKLKKIEDKRQQESLKKKLGIKVYDSLKEGHFWIGMTDEMARIAFGEPKEINQSVGSWGTHEQWVYNNIYLYFENGKLASYQR